MSEKGIEISPQDLRFKFLSNKQLLTTLNIENPTDKRFGFKVKTTAPKKYVVRPSSGIVAPKNSMTIQVVMQAQKDFTADVEKCTDKFMIQSVLMGENEEITKTTFDSKETPGIKEHRLKVIVEGPPPPPSPVPEAANEMDEEAKSAPSMNAPTIVKTDNRAVHPASSELNNDKASLLAQYDKIKKERDEYKKKLERYQMQDTSTHKEKEASGIMSLSILHVIIAALIAYIIGKYIA
uniref:MSP domain-containing protein n=1 Tax=Polytomella parva TaxID=51329 RepID=A0A7S0UMP2_9CHLO|mmetsp:Transcript_11273/g.20391  ORF Transcript_11273/g.20391 Transcript_11273/m.20391 type:complete len:237 (+) Transcript_11273:68-778(+)|eukprot:CAMPEP_0175053040 /NCGR_PEP_ID=MMETSP0052_2-20121109/8698_1 /TAXON_ID=51329 ORGANISM="Polytomella parva, Strain SAG 63-3" /NCGR_SAMPLE_ID=MMETSP0052_2 /ASSEMBLY_ACC=CAM_ASM_000194 /LENGTH=236 /DNA_ID=CAMNT_0016317519 /DNA_START=48 /DNA_END=758 /DNA_ORIENTATION=+